MIKKKLEMRLGIMALEVSGMMIEDKAGEQSVTCLLETSRT